MLRLYKSSCDVLLNFSGILSPEFKFYSNCVIEPYILILWLGVIFGKVVGEVAQIFSPTLFLYGWWQLGFSVLQADIPPGNDL
jgi:hypothetical protein